MKKLFAKFWQGDGGGRQVLVIAMPLILSMSAYTVQLFVDRMFLMWYSSEAMAASMYTGILSLTVLALFSGTAGYVNTFVAQYEGAKRPHRVGASLWQGVYFSIVAGFLIAALAPLSNVITNWAGHDPAVRIEETIYLRILLIGAMPSLISMTLSCFFTGRGQTWIVLWVQIACVAVNIILDYAWIFGRFGFKQYGVAGAAWATVVANTVDVIIFAVIVIKPAFRKKYGTLAAWRFDKELMVRLLRFGLPSGLHFMLDIIGFTLFLTFIGRISSIALTATSIAFQINTLAFMPMIGFSTAVSTIVGRELGADKPHLAARGAWSAAIITMTYMTVIAIGFWIVPQTFMYPFSLNTEASDFAKISQIAATLLKFVAVYCLFDTGNIIFSAAIKGAGDTRFVMYISVVLNWLVLVIPSYLVVRFFEGSKGLYLSWCAATAYVCLLAVVFFLRFINGKWKSMRVIEAAAAPLPIHAPAIPTVEIE